ncbi:MAG: MlaD family protein [bacterium]|nr:MCE family protein [bacterium]MBU1917516.1 MCE family protein [bacterium]
MRSKNFKAGIFVLITLILLGYMIIRVGQGNLFRSSAYNIFIEIESAVGIDEKTQVQIAGVDIGEVVGISLLENQHARLELAIYEGVKISPQAKALVKTRGMLGDVYIEIYQTGIIDKVLEPGTTINQVVTYGDINSVTQEISSIAQDVKAITAQMRKVMAGDDSPFDKTMNNLEEITASISKMTKQNEKNIDVIIENMKALAQNLNYVVAKNMGQFDRTVDNIEDITDDISSGRGTLGRLLKDEETVNKLNDTLDGIGDFLGGANRMKVDLGMHAEYLAGTGNVKNYVSLSLKPRPDKYFLFEVVSDPDPSFNSFIEETIVTSGGNTSTVTTKKRTKTLDGLMFSAQLAKKYHDFTIRGGLVESSGGLGVDYDKGPIGVSFTAFDFKSDEGQKPHLKAMARANITQSFYLLGGLDDFINPNQDLAWYLGAGLTFTDDDIKSLLGVISSVGTASVQ